MLPLVLAGKWTNWEEPFLFGHGLQFTAELEYQGHESQCSIRAVIWSFLLERRLTSQIGQVLLSAQDATDGNSMQRYATDSLV